MDGNSGLPVFLIHVSTNGDRLKLQLVENIVQVLGSLDSRAENDGLVIVQFGKEGDQSSGLFLFQDSAVELLQTRQSELGLVIDLNYGWL